MSVLMKRLATIAVTVAATAALGTSAANAGVSVSNSTPTDGATISATVSSPPSGATKYALALCDTTDLSPLNWGNDCSNVVGSATPVVNISSGTTQSLLVNETFTNRSYIPGGAPLYGPTTDCDATAGSDPCAIVVSWYSAAFAPLGAERALLTFQ